MRRITADEITRIQLPLVDAVNALALDRVNKAKREEMERCILPWWCGTTLQRCTAIKDGYRDEELEDVTVGVTLLSHGEADG